ncbi:hypothetical protein MMC25_007459 [Agyrium rufum]|nr:hypothetical protein [Agyrium rufum]
MSEVASDTTDVTLFGGRSSSKRKTQSNSTNLPTKKARLSLQKPDLPLLRDTDYILTVNPENVRSKSPTSRSTELRNDHPTDTSRRSTRQQLGNSRSVRSYALLARMGKASLTMNDPRVDIENFPKDPNEMGIWVIQQLSHFDESNPNMSVKKETSGSSTLADFVNQSISNAHASPHPISTFEEFEKDYQQQIKLEAAQRKYARLKDQCPQFDLDACMLSNSSVNTSYSRMALHMKTWLQQAVVEVSRLEPTEPKTATELRAYVQASKSDPQPLQEAFKALSSQEGFRESVRRFMGELQQVHLAATPTEDRSPKSGKTKAKPKSTSDPRTPTKSKTSKSPRRATPKSLVKTSEHTPQSDDRSFSPEERQDQPNGSNGVQAHGLTGSNVSKIDQASGLNGSDVDQAAGSSDDVDTAFPNGKIVGNVNVDALLALANGGSLSGDDKDSDDIVSYESSYAEIKKRESIQSAKTSEAPTATPAASERSDSDYLAAAEVHRYLRRLRECYEKNKEYMAAASGSAHESCLEAIKADTAKLAKIEALIEAASFSVNVLMPVAQSRATFELYKMMEADAALELSERNSKAGSG